MSDLSQLLIDQHNPYTLYVQNVVTGGTGANGLSFPNQLTITMNPPNTDPQPVSLAITNNFSTNKPILGLFQNCYFVAQGTDTYQTLTNSNQTTIVNFNSPYVYGLNIFQFTSDTLQLTMNGVFQVSYNVCISWPAGSNISYCLLNVLYNGSTYALTRVDNPSGGVSAGGGSTILSGITIINVNGRPAQPLNSISLEITPGIDAGSLSAYLPQLSVVMLDPLTTDP